MEKPKYQKVSLDTPTYELLGKLAKSKGLSRSSYVRLLIINSQNGTDINAGISPPTLKDALTGKPSKFRVNKRNKAGVVESVLFSDFKLLQRLETQWGVAHNRNIDKEKIKDAIRSALTILLDDLEEAPQGQQ